MSAPPSRPVRVAIVNDYPIVVAGLAMICARHPNRITLVELVAHTPPRSDDVDVVLYDSFAAGNDLQEVVASTTAKVALFTLVTRPAAVTEARRLGAAAYLYKGLSEERLIAAVVAVADTHSEMIVDLGNAVDADSRGRWPGQGDGLTQRESEILALICQGMSNREIADRCYLSINSVKTYIRGAYRKIGVVTRAQAVIWGLNHDFAVAPVRLAPPL